MNLQFTRRSVIKALTLSAGAVVLLGGLRGKLKPGGRYLQLPYYGARQHRTLSNLYLTLLEAAGTRRDFFGVPDNGLRGIDQTGLIHELLA